MSNSLISPQIHEALSRALDSGNVDDFEITVHDPNKKGEGYLGEMLYVTLKDRKTLQDKHLIVKQAFAEQPLRDALPIRTAYVNEINFYIEVWPRLDEFQKTIPEEYQFHKVPRCFASISDENSEKLVLENLRFQKFRTHEKRAPLNDDYYKLLMKEYGRFHAVSFAYKHLHPEEYAGLVANLEDMYEDFGDIEFFPKQLRGIFELSLKSLQPGRDDAAIARFKPYIPDCMEEFTAAATCRTRYTCLTHGDCWSNNMMFKYDESGKPIDVRFLDFQLARDASPCSDLSYCIYSGASKEVLDNLDAYLQLYHQSLSDTLRQFGCDPNEVYPFIELKRDWKRCGKLGFSMGLMIWKVKCLLESEIKDFKDIPIDEQEQIFQGAYDEEAFKKVSRDVILHMYENDFF
ncbi:hypothetical protein NQ315_009887 [Exocentrus adspersus]|uniref:CHK kinase-like domain-containing protein n=1 Tax=Exocentrus adspersus TaxID=1586481 RepID=A0AAV8WIF7_9CUCU|nr:hypothetical protein NQ315_009887 [Exocentrus adspersus]